MAGTYADVPAPRIAYDLIDVDVVYYQTLPSSVARTFSDINKILPRNLSSTQVRQLNSEGIGSASQTVLSLDSLISNNVTFIFRELYDIAAYHLISSDSSTDFGAEQVLTSADTTNALDGTWTLRSSSVSINAYSSRGVYRPPTTLSVSSVIGIRFIFGLGVFSESFSRIHLYGRPTTSPAPVRTQRLAFYSATSDVEFTGANLDLGDVPLSSSNVKSFRLRNYSPASTARNITLSVNQLYPPTTGPSLPAQYFLSLDGLVYSSTVNIPFLYSGQYSDVIYVRKETPFNATTGLWSVRIEASAEDWF